MKMSRIILGGLFFVVAFASAGEDRFTFSADRTEAVLSQGKERTVLTGRAVIETENTVIRADRVELHGENFRFALCSGNIVVEDRAQGFILHCQNLYFDRERELSRVQGYCEMEDQKNGLVVKGSFLENRGDENRTIIQIGVRILKVDEDGRMVCRSEFALYDRDGDTLELSGSPRVNWKGDDYRATRISINLETDEITLEGQVTGTIESEGGGDGE